MITLSTRGITIGLTHGDAAPISQCCALLQLQYAIPEHVDKYIRKNISPELLLYIHHESRQHKRIKHRNRETSIEVCTSDTPTERSPFCILRLNHITACSDLRSIKLGISGMGGTDVSKGLTS